MSFVLRLGFRGSGAPLRLDDLVPGERRIAGALSQLGLLAPFRYSYIWCSSSCVPVGFVLPVLLSVPL